MGIGSALIGLFSSLPQLLKLGSSVWTWLLKVSGNDPQSYIAKVGDAMAKLNIAQTDEERQAAAQAIAESIHGL